MSNIEEMNEFFNKRADGYEAHMLEYNYDFEYYGMISERVVGTEEKIEVLDLGCGTGLELEKLFSKCPNACITGIDMSENMMEILKNKYNKFSSQINLIKGSYIDVSFPHNTYDYVISSMTMHHFTYGVKKELYKNIKSYLKNTKGIYIEGDYMVDIDKEQECLKEYYGKINNLPKDDNNIYHIDIPFAINTQRKLLIEAGFSNVEVIYHKENAAILVASL